MVYLAGINWSYSDGAWLHGLPTRRARARRLVYGDRTYSISFKLNHCALLLRNNLKKKEEAPLRNNGRELLFILMLARGASVPRRLMPAFADQANGSCLQSLSAVPEYVAESAH